MYSHVVLPYHVEIRFFVFVTFGGVDEVAGRSDEFVKEVGKGNEYRKVLFSGVHEKDHGPQKMISRIYPF